MEVASQRRRQADKLCTGRGRGKGVALASRCLFKPGDTDKEPQLVVSGPISLPYSSNGTAPNCHQLQTLQNLTDVTLRPAGSSVGYNHRAPTGASHRLLNGRRRNQAGLDSIQILPLPSADLKTFISQAAVSSSVKGNSQASLVEVF